MTISSTTNRVTFNGNGVSTSYDVSFPFHNQIDLVVLSTVILTGVQTTKVITTHYTIGGVPDAQGHYSNGGTVDFLVAPASTERITIYRDAEAVQGLDLVANDDLPAEATEAQFDYLTMLIQRVKDQINRTLQQPEGDAATVSRLPAKVERASLYLAFDANGDPIASPGTTAVDTPISAFGATLVDDADAVTARTTLGAVPTGLITASGLTQANGKILGRTTASTGAVEEITPGSDLVFSAGALSVQPATTSLAGKVELATQAELAAGAASRVPTTDLKRLDLQAVQATTSGTSFSFTGVPVGTRRVTINFRGVSLSGTDDLLVQIGPVAGVETSAYVSSGMISINAGSTGVSSSTAGFIMRLATAGSIVSGHMVLMLHDADNNVWVESHAMKTVTTTAGSGGGDKAIAGVLSVVKILATGSDTFDAGSVSVVYER